LATEIFIPKMTDFMEEGRILEWLVAEGDLVEEGQPILEVETDKAAAQIDAPATGYLAGIRPGATNGAVIPVGETIAYIVDAPGDAVEPLPPL
jgi:pyruvate/2-oxoglutarate dehydrogenase complex dihydrolipoamide acyltransferase (E2) component